jgi:hypothetical protein
MHYVKGRGADAPSQRDKLCFFCCCFSRVLWQYGCQIPTERLYPFLCVCVCGDGFFFFLFVCGYVQNAIAGVAAQRWKNHESEEWRLATMPTNGRHNNNNSEVWWRFAHLAQRTREGRRRARCAVHRSLSLTIRGTRGVILHIYRQRTGGKLSLCSTPTRCTGTLRINITCHP